MMIAFNSLIASVFYTGYIRKGGGTVAALIAVLLLYFVNSFYIYFLIMAISIIAGTIVSDIAESYWGHDSSRIVIDEFAGMAIALFLLPKNIILFIAAFILFRIFDIFKPFPVNKMQNINTGAGVMLDDIFSGFMANAIIWIYLWIWPLHV